MLNKCYIGDCMDGLQRFVDAGIRVQVCITSPPYFGLRDYGVPGQIGMEETPAEYVEQMVNVFRVIRDVLAGDGTVWLNLGDSYMPENRGENAKPRKEYPSGMQEGHMHADQPTRKSQIKAMNQAGIKRKDLIGIPWRVALALQLDGWYLRNDIIWHKPNPMPESVRDRCTKSHEYLFLLSKSERYYYDADAIREPADPLAGRDSSTARRQVPPGASPDTGFVNGRRYEWRNKRSVWTISTTPYPNAHFAVFPRKLIEPCILAGSRPGDVVLDPFMGSGTTAQVAEHLGRQWIGCEINPEYAVLQANRLRQQTLELGSPRTGEKEALKDEV